VSNKIYPDLDKKDNINFNTPIKKEKGDNKMARILIIDDDPDIVLAVRMSLEAEGYEVIEATSGAQGIDMIKAERPDLIILDVMMETKTEGFQMALKLHSPDPTSEFVEFKDIPILMLTAIHSTTPLRFAGSRRHVQEAPDVPPPGGEEAIPITPLPYPDCGKA
jgi:CheY-like chemotaxis protein